MTGLVQHTFHVYDNMVGNAYDNQDGVEVPQSLAADDTIPGRNDTREREGNLPQDNLNDDREDAGRVDALDDNDLPAMDNAPASQQQILEDRAQIPLFAGSGLTQLGGTLLLLNCLRTHRASNVLVNELFLILSKSMLPTTNSLPRNEYQVLKILKQLGLSYDTIHCCPSPQTCILFEERSTKT